MYPSLVFLNDAFVPSGEARVSAFDRGFVFADGVYEVIPAYGKRLFRFAQHLARLENSLASIRLSNPLPAERWREICQHLLTANPAEDQYIYLQVTRGPAPRDHAFPAETKPTVFAYAQPLKYPEPAQRAAGVAAITVPDIRWQRCDIKAIALLPNVLMRQQATEAGAAEAILLRDGLVTEGSASNIFLGFGNTLVTPPKGPYILPGVTRDLVVELAHAHGIDCEERDVSENEMRNADELMLSSSTKELLAITTLDGRAVGSGKPGALLTRLYALYQDYKRDFRAG
ncbi:MAG: D-amino acid aminotransferase, partial [Gammaproteobacteria bacterium]|nr:D-amino acid aminotransferase [Gammaproteobacteria bacterium]